MLVQLASQQNAPLSVYDIGLDNRTEADGLAVAQASHLVSPLMAAKLAGIFTELYAQLLQVFQAEGMELEPSAAGIGGPAWLTSSNTGRHYLNQHALALAGATLIIWTTGGEVGRWCRSKSTLVFWIIPKRLACKASRAAATRLISSIT